VGSINSTVMVAHSERPNAYSQPPAALRAHLDAASPAAFMAEGPEVYSAALALAQAAPPQGAGGGATLRHVARQLLAVLPTSEETLHDMQRVLESDDAAAELGALLAEPAEGGPPRVKEAVLLYAVQTLCVLTLPQHNPLEPTEAAAAAEARAGALRRRLWPSGALPALLRLLTAQPALGGPALAPTVHAAVLLLVSAAGLELLEAPSPAPAAPAALAAYAVGMMRAALPGFAVDGAAGGGGGGPALSQASQELLCRRGLEVIDLALEADAAVAPGLAPPDPPDPPAAAPPAATLAAVINGMLVSPNAALHGLAGGWVERFARGAPAACRWAFAAVVRPVLLGAAANAHQTALANRFLRELPPSEEGLARSLLASVLQRLGAAAAAGEGAPLKGAAETVLTLVRKLDCREVLVVSGAAGKGGAGGGAGGGVRRCCGEPWGGRGRGRGRCWAECAAVVADADAVR
jgi:hypothetical protein